MASAMSEEACRQFTNWFYRQHTRVFSTYESALRSWMVEEGAARFGHQYGLVVETVLLVLTRDPVDLPVADPSEPNAWDWMGESEFPFEIRLVVSPASEPPPPPPSNRAGTTRW